MSIINKYDKRLKKYIMGFWNRFWYNIDETSVKKAVDEVVNEIRSSANSDKTNLYFILPIGLLVV